MICVFLPCAILIALTSALNASEIRPDEVMNQPLTCTSPITNEIVPLMRIFGENVPQNADFLSPETGQFSKTIPPEITHLTDLKVISFPNHSELTGPLILDGRNLKHAIISKTKITSVVLRRKLLEGLDNTASMISNVAAPLNHLYAFNTYVSTIAMNGAFFTSKERLECIKIDSGKIQFSGKISPYLTRMGITKKTVITFHRDRAPTFKYKYK